MNEPDAAQDPMDFLKPIMIYYLNSIKSYELESQEKSSLSNLVEEKDLELDKESAKHKFTLSNLKQFIKVAPKLGEIRQGIKKMLKKEVIIYKIVLDILGSYTRLFYGIDSKIYLQEYLSTAIDFYKKVTKEDLGTVMIGLMESLNHMNKKEQSFIMRRFVQDILYLPGNDSDRIDIVFNNAYKSYYLKNPKI